jgi:release factor glutamine methyltransferase
MRRWRWRARAQRGERGCTLATAVTIRPVQSDVWTTRRLLAWMMEAFTRHGLDSPRVQAEMLLEHVFGCDRLRLYMDPDRPASPIERQALRELVGRALKNEPVQYLVGHAKFFGLTISVDRRVLIPRPSTATIVEDVLQHSRAQRGAGGGDGLLIADVCTGSGCIALALLKLLPGARVVATDLSVEALEVAKGNAVALGLDDRLELVRGDMLDALGLHPVAGAVASLDYLVSNPPYIPDDEWGAVEPNVKDYEPHTALRGGVDGLDFVRTLAARGPEFVKPGGLMLIEVAASRAAEARALVEANPLMTDVMVLADIDGLARVVRGRRPEA